MAPWSYAKYLKTNMYYKGIDFSTLNGPSRKSVQKEWVSFIKIALSSLMRIKDYAFNHWAVGESGSHREYIEV